MLRPRPGPDGRPSLTQSSSAAALDVPKFVPKVDLQADYSTAKVRGRPPAGREEGSCRGQGAGRHPAPLCVSGHLGCRLPGPAAGTDSAGGAGADGSGAALVRVSALRAGWVGRRGSPGPLEHRPGAGPSVPEGGGSDRAPFGREMLQATCRRTLELARMALLFLSSSLGPERRALPAAFCCHCCCPSAACPLLLQVVTLPPGLPSGCPQHRCALTSRITEGDVFK